jgi:lysophospholipid acyltransferase (LPLAT)-like uncharacterized protein
MKLKLLRSLGRWLGGPLASLLARSWRVKVIDEDRWRSLRDSGEPYLFVLWHEALLPLLWRHRGQGIAIVVSEAREGEYLANYAASLGYRLVRGSSTRGAARALLGAVRELEAGHPVAFTPDGPRGPRRELKPGVVAAAQRAGVRILPIHAEADRAWRFASWDRFMLPKPFARIRIAYGQPFPVIHGETGFSRGLEDTTMAMNDVVQRATCLDGGATLTA